MEYRRKNTKYNRYDHYPYFQDLKIDGGEETHLPTHQKTFFVGASLCVLVYYLLMFAYLNKTVPENELSYFLSYSTMVLSVLCGIAFGIYTFALYIERRLGEEMGKIC